MGSPLSLGFWFAVAMALLTLLIAPALYVRIASSPFVYSDISRVPSVDVIVVPGASVVRGKQSPILAARTEEAKIAYQNGKANTILITGAVEPNYDEVTPMREYLLEQNIPENNILIDRSGVDTYRSIHRSRSVFRADSIIIVTQDFHLPRAIFLARSLGINAYGLLAPRGGTLFDYLREIPASWKALWDVLQSPKAQDEQEQIHNVAKR